MLAPDEFQFLASDAARVGVSNIPEVRRIDIRTRDGDVSTLRYGSGSPAFTFVHGAGLNAHTFDPTILRLQRPALSLDLPGHGRSAWRADAQYHPDRLARAVAEVLHDQTQASQVLVGHSLGGLTSLAVAAEHPDLVRHLVLIDITPGITPGDGGASIREFITGQRSFASVDEIIDRAIAFGIGHDREALRRGITLNTRVRADGDLEWTHHLAHMTGEMLAPDYATLWDALDAVHNRGIPISLIRGSEGMVHDGLVAEWQTRAGFATVHTITAGHNIQEHDPVALAELLNALSDS